MQNLRLLACVVAALGSMAIAGCGSSNDCDDSRERRHRQPHPRRPDDHTLPPGPIFNPVAEKHWGYSESINIIKKAMNNRMFPLTLEGLDGAMRELVR